MAKVFTEIVTFSKKVRKKILKSIRAESLIEHIMPANKIDLSHVKSFSDIYENKPVHGLAGSKVCFDDIVNVPIVITNFKAGLKSRFHRTKDGDETYTAIQFFFLDDEEQNLHIFNTGSEVLLEKLIDLKEKIPFKAVIIKENRCLKFR